MKAKKQKIATDCKFFDSDLDRTYCTKKHHLADSECNKCQGCGYEKRKNLPSIGYGCKFLECDPFFHMNQCLKKALEDGLEVEKGCLIDGYPCHKCPGCGFEKREEPKREKLTKEEKDKFTKRLRVYGKIQEIKESIKELEKIVGEL